MYAAEEKIFAAELAPAEKIFIPFKFSGRGAQRHRKICSPKKMNFHFLRKRASAVRCRSPGYTAR